jgi:NTE family protein
MTTSSPTRRMKALVLSAGGSDGAYEVGAVLHLIAEAGHRYDIYCGISVGALNAVFLSMFETDREKVGAEKLANFWSSLTTSRVYRPRFFGALSALWNSSVYSTLPLSIEVTREIDPHAVILSGKELRIGATDLETGELRVFTQDTKQIHQAVMASAALPGLFPPVTIGDRTYVDGGVHSETPISMAVRAGADEIHVVMCTARRSKAALKRGMNAIDVASRALDILLAQVAEDNFMSAVTRPWDKPYELRVIRPRKPLDVDAMEFDPEVSKTLIAQGAEDARIEMGETGGVKA